MNQKEEKSKNKKNLALLLLVAVVVVYIIFLFAFRKEGFHSDEPWSYGYSNGYYTGLFYYDEKENDLHLYEWLSPDIFRDYLSVSKEHRFAYDSVLYNLKKDNTVSPLYYLALHTICSFFPDSFSWWYGFAINLVALVVFLVTLYALCDLISNSKVFSLVCTGFIGFSTGMQSCFIYIRPYALMLAWVMILLYLHMRIYKKEFKKVGKEITILFVITLLGGLTQTFFYLIAFFLAAFTDFYLLFSKKWKVLIGYSFAMLAAVGVSYLLWPYPFINATQPDKIFVNRLPFLAEMRKVGPLFGGESIGIPIFFPTRFSNAIALGVIGVLGMLIVAIMFISRKDAWYLKFKKDLPDNCKKFWRNLKRIAKNGNKMLWIFVLAMNGAFLANIPFEAGYTNMYVWVDRYFFFLMPLFALLFGYVVFCVGRSIKKKVAAKCVGILLCAGLFLSNQLAFPCNYFFDTLSVKGVGLEEAVKGKDVILVIDATWEMVYYAVALRNANSILIMRNAEVMTIPLDLFEKETTNACLVCQTNYLRDDTLEAPEEWNAEYLIRMLHTYEFSEEEMLTRLMDFSFINRYRFVDGLDLYTGIVHIYSIE